MDIQGLIAEKLESIDNVSDKDLLRNLLEEVFVPIYEHSEQKYMELENRIRSELPQKADRYYICATAADAKKARGLSPYLFPVFDEDAEERRISIKDISAQIAADGCAILETVFLPCSYTKCGELIQRSGRFQGQLALDSSSIPISVQLRLAKRYTGAIKRLYDFFNANGIPWTSVNAPYFHKFFDAVITKIDCGDMNEDTVINAVEIDYGTLRQHIRRGLIPLWNVQRLHIESSDFPIAAVDKRLYEYTYGIEEEGTQHGYLIDFNSAPIVSVRREAGALIVASPERDALQWDMVKIHKRPQYSTEIFEYPVMTNAQEDSFASRMISSYGLTIKTKAELIRLIRSYEAAKGLSLDSIQIVDGIRDGETYDVNPFLTDELRDGFVSKTMLLQFRRPGKDSFTDQDILSFLVTQIQLAYPEFHCTGVFV